MNIQNPDLNQAHRIITIMELDLDYFPDTLAVYFVRLIKLLRLDKFL